MVNDFQFTYISYNFFVQLSFLYLTLPMWAHFTLKYIFTVFLVSVSRREALSVVCSYRTVWLEDNSELTYVLSAHGMCHRTTFWLPSHLCRVARSPTMFLCRSSQNSLWRPSEDTGLTPSQEIKFTLESTHGGQVRLQQGERELEALHHLQ